MNHPTSPLILSPSPIMSLIMFPQSISVLESLRRVGGVRGPFLLVAPLTTLGHWQREIRTWTDMVCGGGGVEEYVSDRGLCRLT